MSELRPTLTSISARPTLPSRARSIEWPWPLSAWPIRLGLAGLLALALFAALALGGGVLPLAALAGGLVIGLALAWHYPEVGILGLVFLGSRILDPNLVQISLPIGGGIDLADMALIGLAGMSVVRQARRGAIHIPRTWVAAPMLVWLWIALFSALMALLVMQVEVSWALSELRGIVYYGVFFLVTWDIKEKAQLERLLLGLFAIALLVTGVMLIQQFVGPVPLFAGQESSSWQIIGQRGGGVTRIRPPAHVLLYYISILSFVVVPFLRRPGVKILSLGISLFLNAALLLTFTRSQWVASVLAIGLAFLLFPAGARKALAVMAVALGLAAGLLIGSQRSALGELIAEKNFATPLVMRIESVFTPDETLNSYSAQTRYMQTGAALASIQANPIFGVGLGNAYRGLTPAEAETRYTRFTRFIENSYLYMTTKMGLPALLTFLWLAAAVLWSAWRTYRKTPEPLFRGVALAGLTSYAGLVAWAFNHPLAMLPEYTIMVGLIAGITAVTGLLNSEMYHESPF